MAKYPNITLVNTGFDMVAESQGSGQLIFTCIKLGDGTLTEGEDIKALTVVKHPMLTANISDTDSTVAGQVSIMAVISNMAVETGFFAREVGIYAKIGTDGTERLYAYTNAGNYGDYMPDKSQPVDENKIKITIIIGNASSVSAEINSSLIYPTQKEVNDIVEKHNTDTAAHPDLREALKKAGLNSLQRKQAYAVGDVAYSNNLPSWVRLDCTAAGTTADTEPVWGILTEGQNITDGAVTWLICDVKHALYA